MSAGSSVPIPNNVDETIQNIKEIAGNHNDEEIQVMIREESTDPNETTQKLLLQDTFHEVRRKRDREEENLKNREPVDSRWKSGVQGRGGRGGCGNYSPCYVSHDAGGGRNALAGKENGVNQGTERGVTPSLPVSQDTENKGTSPASSSVTVVANSPVTVATGSFSHSNASQLPTGSGMNTSEDSLDPEKHTSLEDLLSLKKRLEEELCEAEKAKMEEEDDGFWWENIDPKKHTSLEDLLSLKKRLEEDLCEAEKAKMEKKDDGFWREESDLEKHRKLEELLFLKKRLEELLSLKKELCEAEKAEMEKKDDGFWWEELDLEKPRSLEELLSLEKRLEELKKKADSRLAELKASSSSNEIG